MPLNCKTPAEVLQVVKDNEVKYIDLRFTDPRGKWQHLTMTADFVDEDAFTDGLMFDGSSIAGWKAINDSDMALIPDATTAVMDPFAAQSCLVLFCDVIEPSTGEAYIRDPRSIAKKAEAYVTSSGIGDTVYVGPEAEFFVFDDVRYEVKMNSCFYEFSSDEGPYVTGRILPEGNAGHRPPIKGGYFPVPPVDSCMDLRAEMVSTMMEMGLVMDKHHHEVAPSQHELGLVFSTLVKAADNIQIYKYCTHMVAQTYGKTATFMPKPIFMDNGSGMHTHMSLWKGNTNLFAGSGYAGMSDTAMYAIGGILKHARALLGFTNPTTNSYKRLVPGYEAPVNLAYSRRNRSASVRIPVYSPSPKAKRFEFRCPDSSCNPYLAFSAILMAALDGIQNKTDPGEPLDKDIYDLTPEELKDVPQACGSLDEALDSLEKDHEFLLRGDVFTEDVISTWIWYKREKEIDAVRLRPHPYEFCLYFDM